MSTIPILDNKKEDIIKIRNILLNYYIFIENLRFRFALQIGNQLQNHFLKEEGRNFSGKGFPTFYPNQPNIS